MKTTTKIENHKGLFNSKEEYLELRKNWRAFINSGKAKKYLVERTFQSYNTGQTITQKFKVCDLTWEHHILYAMLRGKDMTDCFRPSPNIEKKPSQFNTELRQIEMKLRYITEKPENSLSVEWLTGLRIPFGESLTVEILKKLWEYLKENKLSNVINA